MILNLRFYFTCIFIISEIRENGNGFLRILESKIKQIFEEEFVEQKYLLYQRSFKSY